MGIITRERWGAVHEDGFSDAPLPAEEMWLHHSAALMPDVEWVDRDRDGVDDSEAAAMRQLEQIGEQRFGRGISYTHGVVPAGRIYEGHGVGRQGAHTKGRNSRARAIVWLGNFDVHRPTRAMIRATAWLLQEYVRRGWLRHARLSGGHQQAPGAATACPGTWAMAAIPEINKLAAGPPITLEDDVLTDKQARQLDELHRLYRKGNATPGYPQTAGDMTLIVIEMLKRGRRMEPLLEAVVAKLTADPDITASALRSWLDESVAEHTPSAAAIAGELRPMISTDIGPLVRELFAETLAGDDEAEADALSTKFMDKLAARLAAEQTDTTTLEAAQ